MTFWSRIALSCAPLLVFASSAQQSPAERGRYLVEEVAKCQDCHTPHLQNGQPDHSKWLKGAVLDFQPIRPILAWRALAPDITPSGRLFQKWGQKGMIQFLRTAIDPYGHPAGPPMPDYRLKAEDAEALVLYLKTLK